MDIMVFYCQLKKQGVNILEEASLQEKKTFPPASTSWCELLLINQV
jgi:hypothetical protein